MSFSSLSSLSEDEYSTRRNPDKLNAFQAYNDMDFKRRFRLSKETVLHLCSIIQDNIQPATKRNKAIQPIDQILIALRFFATGSFQKVIGDIFHVDQSTVHDIVHRVAAELAKLKTQFINMPTPDEQRRITRELYSIAGFPNVIGLIDCTQVRIKSPGGMQAEIYRNRKGLFSLNMQVVCDAQLLIRNIIARWPGSVHDSTIFNDSPLCAQMEQGHYANKVLLGDSGYPCRRYLLTPVLNPSTPPEEAYNRAHIKTRNTIERLFGILKRRFPCLHIGLQVKHQNVPAIIVACSVLHNIAITRQDFIDEEENDELSHFTSPPPPGGMNENFIMRNNTINAFFTN